MITIGLLGYGYWGINLLRNFVNTPNCRVRTVCDSRPERLALARKTYPNIAGTRHADDVLNDPAIDAVVIATPVSEHYPMARQALLAGKHVLVEKPFTASVDQARELLDLAARRNRIVMVDHTFLFTDAVQQIKRLTDAGELGRINYFDSTRINLGLFQPDVNVIWDLAPHDLSILNYLVAERPISVVATGSSHTRSGLENIAYLTLYYASDFIAHFTCSWISPLKIRRILIGGTRRMVLFDDVEPTEKVKMYDTGFSVKSEEEKHRMLVDYRVGNIFIPKIAQKEALADLAAEFINAIFEDRPPLTDGQAGLEVVEILEAAQASINQRGREIRVETTV
jgi:predicted dehydrogenase